MKFICLGYYDDDKWGAQPEKERNTFVDECLSYDEVLRAKGHFAGGEALQPASTAKTVRYSDNKVKVTDGPYAETKEQIGGMLILEAENMDHAIELMSRHPGVKAGPFEIRAVADMSGAVQESERRRGVKKK